MAKQYKILDILNGCHKKQSKYQRALVDQYSGYLFATCKRYMKDDGYAKDLVQESLVRIFKNLESYDADKGSFQAWITTIAIRVCLTKLRRKKLQLVGIDDKAASETMSADNVLILDKMNTSYLLEMVKELPDGYREVFNMAAIDGYPHAEIAKQLNITETTSRSWLSRGRRILRRKIENLNKQELWVNSI